MRSRGVSPKHGELRAIDMAWYYYSIYYERSRQLWASVKVFVHQAVEDNAVAKLNGEVSTGSALTARV